MHFATTVTTLICAALLAACVTTPQKADTASSEKGTPAAKTATAPKPAVAEPKPAAPPPVAKPGPGLFESKSGYALNTGLAEYADGKFSDAARDLQSALDLGLGSGDQIKAHKHLAFIHCVSGRKHACREEFLKALDVDPDFQLEPAEAGHPIWGPVFKSAKAAKAAKPKSEKKTAKTNKGNKADGVQAPK